jgi:hypothetical protein
LQSEDIQADMRNSELVLINIVRSRFRDDIILRLSELSSTKHGRLNFHFAADKIGSLKQEVKEYEQFLHDKHIVFRRNKNIGHKQITPRWTDIDAQPHIPYFTLLRAISGAIRLIKYFDSAYYGGLGKAIWRLERTKRYELIASARAKYLLFEFQARV